MSRHCESSEQGEERDEKRKIEEGRKKKSK